MGIVITTKYANGKIQQHKLQMQTLHTALFIVRNWKWEI